jgi:hypothetical protein
MSSAAERTISLSEYYKEFISLFGAIATVVAALPLVALFGLKYLFPPLGGEGIEGFAKVMTVIFSLCTTLLVYFTKNTFASHSGGRRKRILASVLVASVTFLAIHIMLHTVFVRDIYIPTQKQTVTVSVGRHRNAKNPKEYAQMSDEAMLRDAGPEEESIRRLFTMQSLLVSRVLLYVTYVVSVLCIVAFGSFSVLFTALDKRAPSNLHEATGNAN